MFRLVSGLALLLSSMFVLAETPVISANKDQVSRILDNTDLGANLKTLENYYQTINQQLGKQLANHQRDPFERPALPTVSDNSKSVKPRFIPKSLPGVSDNTAAKKLATPRADFKANKQASGYFPEMQFRGFLKSNGDKAGLLEIVGQGTFVVHEGDRVGLQQSSGDMVIRVVEINALNLIVEFGSLGEKMMVQ